ncbi:hypothetical protein F8M41_014246 [Gigaspora margarita]|uniref:Uncharacterized protein n=1 Tax=Gigaspora margarita TaxID=4874 RepID=A0A8H3ZXY7_GIGMA|nr:hypothetical protein F8M41_014246 [Gigaspora margarita]
MDSTQQENQQSINTKLWIRGVITSLRTLLARKSVIKLQQGIQGFEETLLLDISERKQIQVYETEIFDLKEELRNLAIDCNININQNFIYSEIQERIDKIDIAQKAYYLRYFLEEEYFPANE